MPDGWIDTSLGEIADLRIGRTPPRNDRRFWTDDLARPFCSIADMVGSEISPVREGVTELAEREGKAKRVPKGSLLLSFKLTIGRVGFAAVDLFPNEAIAWITPRGAEVEPRYLALWLGHADLREGSGRAVKGDTLNSESLRAISVRVPPLYVQRRIVDLMATVDLAIMASRSLTDSARAGARAVVADIVGRATEASALGQVAVVRGGKRLPKGTPWAARPTAHPYIRVVDLADGRVHDDDLVHVPDDVWPLIQRYIVEAGDVVVSIVGTIGEVAVVPHRLHRANLTENAALVRPGPSLDSDFLAAFLRSEAGQREIARLTVGTTQAKLALFRIEQIEVPSLSLDAQRECASVHEALERVAQAATTHATRLGRLRAALLSSLLIGESVILDSYDRFLDGAA